MVYAVIDAVIENEYHDMDYYLVPASNTVNNPNFELGLVKAYPRHHLSLTSTEKQVASNLLKALSSLPPQGIESSKPHMSYLRNYRNESLAALAINKINTLIVHFDWQLQMLLNVCLAHAIARSH
jgi:hypothetical protein